MMLNWKRTLLTTFIFALGFAAAHLPSPTAFAGSSDSGETDEVSWETDGDSLSLTAQPGVSVLVLHQLTGDDDEPRIEVSWLSDESAAWKKPVDDIAGLMVAKLATGSQWEDQFFLPCELGNCSFPPEPFPDDWRH